MFLHTTEAKKAPKEKTAAAAPAAAAPVAKTSAKPVAKAAAAAPAALVAKAAAKPVAKAAAAPAAKALGKKEIEMEAKRVHSRAYHAARKVARAEGLDDKAAKENFRQLYTHTRIQIVQAPNHMQCMCTGECIVVAGEGTNGGQRCQEEVPGQAPRRSSLSISQLPLQQFPSRCERDTSSIPNA